MFDTTPPSSPTGLISVAKDSAVDLKWTLNTEGDLSYYNVYRSTSAGGTYAKINPSNVTTNSYTDSTAINGTIYYYKITAVDTSSNESGYSEYTIAKPGVYPPQASGTLKIAFYSYRDGNQEIYVMHSDGTAQTNLTNNSAGDWYPSFSQDGTKIAFQSGRDGNYEIYVMNSDGTAQTNLTNNSAEDYYPSFSQDGTKIAWTSSRDGNWEIYVMNADGTAQTRLTNNNNSEWNWEPSFSPDGTKIAFTSSRDGNGEIYVMNADGTGQTRLTNNSADDWHPSFSQDGTKIAFTSWRDGNAEIYVMHSDGTAQTNLTNNSADDWEPSLSPDGTKIAWTSSRDGNWEIYVMHSDGTAQTRLTNNSEEDKDPSFSGAVFETTPPSAPTGLTVTDPQTGGQLNLEWTANTESDLAGYNVYRSSTETGTYEKINTSLVLKPTTNYTDTALTNGTTYWYKITAVDDFGNKSSYSSAVSGVPTSGGGDTQAPTITHTPITSAIAGNDILISATITDNVSVSSATLYYRKTDTTTWTSVTMSKSGDTYTATIPASDVTTSGVQYYIQAQDAKPNISRSPNTAPSTPYSISVTSGADNTPPTITHTPIISATAGNNILISATITDNVSVAGATLYYRKTGTTTFTILTMTKSGDTYTATIPALQVTSSGVDYYIEASDARPNISRSPNTAPSTPYFINVTVDDNTAPVISHTKVEISKSNVDINITCTATDDVGVDSVTLYYRKVGDANFTSLSMTKSGNTYTATIPALQVTSSGVDYYIEASDARPNISRSPNTAPSTPYQIAIDDVYPVANITNLTTDQIVGGTFTILGNANDSNLDEYLVEYGAGTNPTVWKEIFKGSANVNNGQLAIWDTSMLSGTYTIRITAKDKAGNTQKAQVTLKVYNVIILPKQLPPAKKWGMMGVLLNPVNSSTDSVFNISGAKVYRWDPTIPDANEDAKFRKYVKPTTIKPGEGYWVMTDTGGNIAVQGSLVDQTRNVEVHIYPGWNQISSPFNFSVKWKDVKVRYLGVEKSISDAANSGWIREYLYWYDGQGYLNSQTNPNAVLESWASYWVKANYECDLIIPPIESATPKLKEVISYPEGAVLKISAKAGEYQDVYNFIGIKENANNEYDIYDVEKPPSISPSVEVYFPHLDWGEYAGRYASDFRQRTEIVHSPQSIVHSQQGTEKVWEMVVETDIKNTPVSLNFEEVIPLPSGYQVRIVDLATNQSIGAPEHEIVHSPQSIVHRGQKNRQEFYSYNSGSGGKRYFRIIVGKKLEVGGGQEEPLSLQVHNFPNPDTTGNTTFKYNASPEISRVTIEVYNLAGRLVDRFEDLTPTDGTYQWQFGKRLANGVYIYRITVQDIYGREVSRTGKLAVLR